MSAIERWLFAPGSDRRLAAMRFGLCALLAYRMSRGLYLELAGQPRELFRPLSFMQLLDGMPPRAAVLALQVIGVTAAALAAAGLLTRASFGVAFACALVLNGMATSIGKVVHNDVLLLLAAAPLLIAPSADAWSLDARRRWRQPELRVERWSVRYGWPVRLASLAIAGGYFFAGYAKLKSSGVGWVSSGNMRWILFAASDNQPEPNAIGLFIANRAWLAHLAAAGLVLFELSYPLVLWKARAPWVFVPGTVLFSAGIYATLGLDYSVWAATAVIVFVNWPVVLGRFARGAESYGPRYRWAR